MTRGCQASSSAAIAAAARRGLERAGHEVDVIDLHRDGFDPVMHEADLAAWRMKSVRDEQAADYQARLQLADHAVFVFPIWWESMPATTKGFLDKVMTKGIVYSESKPGRHAHDGDDHALPHLPLAVRQPDHQDPVPRHFPEDRRQATALAELHQPSSKSLEKRQDILQGIEARFAAM